MSSAASGRSTGRDGAGTGTGGAPPSTGRALIVRPDPAPRRFAAPWLSHGLVAATVAVVMGTGFVAGTAAVTGRPQPVAAASAAPHADTQMDVLYRVQGEVRALKASLDGLRANAETRSQDDAIRGLKRSVDLIKQDLEGVRTASSGAIGQLGAKIDRLDRDPGPKLAEISARLDKLDREPNPKLADIVARLDKLDRDPGQKLADISARMDRLERQASSPAITGSIAPQAPQPPAKSSPPSASVSSKALPTPVAAKTPPASVAAKTPPTPVAVPRPEVPVARQDEGPHPDSVARAEPPKPATVEGWMLRDVYNGMALVEGRGGGLREVAPGEFIPGVGEIRSIERRGRSWVVVTSRGIIQADNRW